MLLNFRPGTTLGLFFIAVFCSGSLFGQKPANPWPVKEFALVETVSAYANEGACSIRTSDECLARWEMTGEQADQDRCDLAYTAVINAWEHAAAEYKAVSR